MKQAVFLFGSVVSMMVFGTEMKYESYFFNDDFERSEMRSGNPERVTGMIAPGLLSQTTMGRYRGSSVTILPERDGLKVPIAGKLKLAFGYRLYSLGAEASSVLLTHFKKGEQGLLFKTERTCASPVVKCTLGSMALEVPNDALPADFVLLTDDSGNVELSATSLSDSNCRTVKGTLPFFSDRSKRPCSIRMELKALGASALADATLDNIFSAIATPARKMGNVPAKIKPLDSFDPVKAGWPLVFSDEFEGKSLDLKKWEARSITGMKHTKVKDGKLVIDVGFKEDGKTLETGSVWTRPSFLYGYFEARLKFTRQNGWWAAFWLYGNTVSNPFLDGFEIDIFEDYYTRRLDEKGRNRPLIDHNLHMYVNSTLKSWNYIEELQGSLDDYQVIGCKWTPFEISYYMNGKLIASSAKHSPWNSVTFDPFNHGVGAVPLRAILSGQIMNPASSWLKGLTDLSKCKFPDHYYVDYIRIYGYPDPADEKPSVSWAEKYESSSENIVKEGTRLTYRVNAVSAAKTSAPIEAVYLFDSGYLLECKTKPPFEFAVECTQKYFEGTDFMRPGRQRIKPHFDGTHALVAFAQDANGKISKTDALEFMIVCQGRQPKPFQGKAAQIPGVIDPAYYDEGGQGVAYSDGSKGNMHGTKANWRLDEDVDCKPGTVGGVGGGEWVCYTVDIAEAGDYEVTFKYGTPSRTEQSMLFLLDLKRVGKAELEGQEVKYGWSARKTGRAMLKLPAGRHVLRLVLNGNYNFGKLEFRKVR